MTGLPRRRRPRVHRAERALWAPVSIVILGLITFVMVATHRHLGTGR